MNPDVIATRAIYNFVNGNSYTRHLPYYLGLLPYELYVLPGMFLAMIQVILFSAFNPIQFHLLPHFFAFSLFQLIKGTVGRERPGCSDLGLSDFIDPSHCSGRQRFLSFPSGHTGIAFALAIALYMEMNHSSDPKFFDIRIKNEKSRKLISFLGFFVAFFISIHRISKGYHFLSDTIVGAILGGAIGYITWKIMEKYKKGYNKYCEDNNEEWCAKEIDSFMSRFKLLSNSKKARRLEFIGKMILLIPVIFLLFKFFLKDFWNLSGVKH